MLVRRDFSVAVLRTVHSEILQRENFAVQVGNLPRHQSQIAAGWPERERDGRTAAESAAYFYSSVAGDRRPNKLLLAERETPHCGQRNTATNFTRVAAGVH